jgi:large subunit ribosomal protein L10
MAVSKSKKQVIFSGLTNEIATQKSVVILTTNGTETMFNASSNYEFRKAARANGIKIQVVKNTLINKTFTEVPKLTGVTMLAYLVNGSESDEVTVAKNIVDVIKENFKAEVNVLGSVVNGEFYDNSKTIQLSKVSTKEESMAKMAGALNQITARIAIAVKEVPASIARGLNAYQKTL